MTSYAKAKSATKVVCPRSESLTNVVSDTMAQIAAIVGSTLGPGGAPVLIERQEFGLPPIVTKDGVTVFQSLGFDDPIKHAVMEAARDAAVRTVSEAGDGTTTATVLANALVRYTQQYHAEHPEFPPQQIAERLRTVFEEEVYPWLQKQSTLVDFGTEKGRKLLRAVATVSANGDRKLADAVLECFDLVGDQGTVTISERSGPPGYKVEKIDGYPISAGYEESCAKFANVFLNEPGNGRCYLTKPYFILYNGVCTDIQALYAVLERMQRAWLNREGLDGYDPSQPSLDSPHIVLIANGFAEQVLATLALNWTDGSTINVLPVVTPRNILPNGESHLLADIAAITGAEVLDPLNRNFDSTRIPGESEISDVGRADAFEMLRFRSTIFGHVDDDLVTDRAEILESMVKSAASELDARILNERLASLVGGIARLWVIGGSQGELRERKDRADDAVRAVQGAIREGVLPGGGWALVRSCVYLMKHYRKGPEAEVLGGALLEPVLLLLRNTGIADSDASAIVNEMASTWSKFVFDASAHKWVHAYKEGILDSAPAVISAIRNAISIASLLGTLGGVVVFKRDTELERREAQSTNSYMRDTGLQEQ